MEKPYHRFGAALAVQALEQRLDSAGGAVELPLIEAADELARCQIRLQGICKSFGRSINTVFQSYTLSPHLNVYENITFGLKARKLPLEETRQRVALARALANQPDVLLLDEPMLGSRLGNRKRSADFY